MLTPITVLYAAIFGLMLMVLSGRLPIARRKFRIGIGTGGNAELARMIRVQGNFTEYVPMALLLMLLNEMNAPHAVLLHGYRLAAGPADSCPRPWQQRRHQLRALLGYCSYLDRHHVSVRAASPDFNLLIHA